MTTLTQVQTSDTHEEEPGQGGRSIKDEVANEVRDLIRRMNVENPLWAPLRSIDEVLKLGIQVAQSTVST